MTTSTREIQHDEDLAINQNPSADMIFVKGSDQIEQVRIISLDGQILLSEVYSAIGVDISNLSNGVYLIELKSAGGTTLKRFMKN